MLIQLDKHLIQAIANIEQCQVKILQLVHTGTIPTDLNIEVMSTFRHSVWFLGDATVKLGIPGSNEAFRGCLNAFGSLDYTDGRLNGTIESINGLHLSVYKLMSLFIAHTKETPVFVCDRTYAAYAVQAALPFGPAVNVAFPSAIEDICEAAKCLAFERHTACVFHLMRAMEASLPALTSQLGVVGKESQWGHFLSTINDSVEKMPKGATKTKWSEVVALLFHVKEAWRNPTMHPKNAYTEAEAKGVFSAVEAFLKKLASLVAEPKSAA